MRELAFRLEPGDLLKEELERRTRDVSGVVLSLVGSLENARLRMAGATPAGESVADFPGPFEIVSATGTFSPDGSHLYIAVADAAGRVWGGHLKDSCVVATTVEVVIGILEETSLMRVLDAETGYAELKVR